MIYEMVNTVETMSDRDPNPLNIQDNNESDSRKEYDRYWTPYRERSPLMRSSVQRRQGYWSFSTIVSPEYGRLSTTNNITTNGDKVEAGNTDPEASTDISLDEGPTLLSQDVNPKARRLWIHI